MHNFSEALAYRLKTKIRFYKKNKENSTNHIAVFRSRDEDTAILLAEFPAGRMLI